MDQFHSSGKEVKWQPEVMLNPKDFNKNIMRNQYYRRTKDDLNAELLGSKYFTPMYKATGWPD